MLSKPKKQPLKCRKHLSVALAINSQSYSLIRARSIAPGGRDRKIKGLRIIEKTARAKVGVVYLASIPYSAKMALAFSSCSGVGVDMGMFEGL